MPPLAVVCALHIFVIRTAAADGRTINSFTYSFALLCVMFCTTNKCYSYPLHYLYQLLGTRLQVQLLLLEYRCASYLVRYILLLAVVVLTTRYINYYYCCCFHYKLPWNSCCCSESVTCCDEPCRLPSNSGYGSTAAVLWAMGTAVASPPTYTTTLYYCSCCRCHAL